MMKALDVRMRPLDIEHCSLADIGCKINELVAAVNTLLVDAQARHEFAQGHLLGEVVSTTRYDVPGLPMALVATMVNGPQLAQELVAMDLVKVEGDYLVPTPEGLRGIEDLKSRAARLAEKAASDA